MCIRDRFKAMLETKDEMANNLVNHGMIVEHNLARLYAVSYTHLGK